MARSKFDLSQAELQYQLRYSEFTGNFMWKCTPKKSKLNAQFDYKIGDWVKGDTVPIGSFMYSITQLKRLYFLNDFNALLPEEIRMIEDSVNKEEKWVLSKEDCSHTYTGLSEKGKKLLPKEQDIRNFWAYKISYLKQMQQDCFFIEDILDIECNVCFACGNFSTSNRTLHRAHIKPECYGGSSTVENIHMLCIPCHRSSEGLYGYAYKKWLTNRSWQDRWLQESFSNGCNSGTIFWEMLFSPHNVSFAKRWLRENKAARHAISNGNGYTRGIETVLP